MLESRREFLTASGMAVLGLTLGRTAASGQPAEPIIDIHQHLNYSGRPDDVFLAHQRTMGITTTILLPAGRTVSTPSTHQGTANMLQAEALGNEACYLFARKHGTPYRIGANEVPDLPDARQEVERYLKLGAVVVGEQKFGVDCDSPEMQRMYQLAEAHDVPVLMHWQFKMFNYGLERFAAMLEKFPKVRFIGHAQTFWANVDRRHQDQSVLYPKGPITPGGITDDYLTRYPNMFGDLSAASGQNALTRDEAFARDFLSRHQDKLLFGSDCSDHDGTGPRCIGAQTIAIIRRLAASKPIERKLLYENATRVFRL